jgi:DNA repair protein RecN (Recombination protein N)
MLLDLTIHNFAIIDSLQLTLCPRLNVFTGETGAGKSIIVDAISALVGERVGTDVVRTGTERATVEAIFDVSAQLRGEQGTARPVPDERAGDERAGDERHNEHNGRDEHGGLRNGHENGQQDGAGEGESFSALLMELGIEPEDGTLILSREILSTGRGIARINRRAVPLSSLQRVARFLVDIHGQSAHLALLRPEQHVYYLDRYAGTQDLQAQVADLAAQARAARRELDRMRRDEREIERRIELLRYQVDEIEAARLRPGELDELETERRRLANAERLGELCAAIYGGLAGDTDRDTAGALDTLATVQRALGELLRLDNTLRDQLATLDQGYYLLQDVASAVRTYQDEVAADPERQAEVEERLDLIAKLRRKYGATIEEIVAYGEAAAAELDELTHREERASELQKREQALRERIGEQAGELSQRRQAAAVRLAEAMERQLDDLNMQRARFQVSIVQQQDEDGVPVRMPALAAKPAGRGRSAVTPAADVPLTTYAFGPTGIDRVEFLIAPNQGEAFKPLARIASGGETSRLMLALKTILAQADIVPVLIFDEIDAGISGRSGQTVGEKLWRLGQTHQVLCVTHLPQIAAMGDCHFRVAKRLERDRTTTQVESLPEEARVMELGQMLGGANTAASRANASELLERAAVWKHGQAQASEPASQAASHRA